MQDYVLEGQALKKNECPSYSINKKFSIKT